MVEKSELEAFCPSASLRAARTYCAGLRAAAAPRLLSGGVKRRERRLRAGTGGRPEPPPCVGRGSRRPARLLPAAPAGAVRAAGQARREAGRLPARPPTASVFLSAPTAPHGPAEVRCPQPSRTATVPA